MRFFLACFGALALGCGARTISDFDLDETVGDASADSFSIDTASLDTATFDTGRPPPPDTRPPPPMTCELPLDPSFACLDVPKLAGKKVCNDAAIRALTNACFFGGDGGSCEAARKKYGACSKCVIEEWIAESRLESGACIQKIDPKSSCGRVINCTYDCLASVCSECDPEPGSGKGGGSAADDCYENAASTGGCYDLAAKDYTECASDPRFSVCIPNTEEDLIMFYRGACRDGADWSKASAGDGT